MLNDCPKCGLTNPPEALWCDCGYDFSSGKLTRETLPEAKRLSIAGKILFFLFPQLVFLGGYIALFIVAVLCSIIYSRVRKNHPGVADDAAFWAGLGLLAPIPLSFLFTLLGGS